MSDERPVDATKAVDSAAARTAVVETTHADDAAAATVAAALSPDNTDEIRTTNEERTVATRVERGTTGGLLASVDDYLVNLDVADDAVALGRGSGSDTTAARDAAADNDADGIRDTADDANTHDT